MVMNDKGAQESSLIFKDNLHRGWEGSIWSAIWLNGELLTKLKNKKEA